jgi:sugar O-acyltransferase (sialic acid O-acetyltransferase NeuD family)
MNHLSLSLKRIAIIGYGGIAREISCNFKKTEYEYFINNNYINKDNINIVKPLEEMDINKYKVLICIGDPNIRKKIVSELPLNTEYYTYIDKHAIILDKNTVSIGVGSVITAGSVLTTNIKIGKFNHINLNTTIGHDTILNDFISTTPGVHISGNVNIGNNVYFGCGAVVRNNISICDNTIIGMNAVVTKNIIEPGTYIGCPVRKMY